MTDRYADTDDHGPEMEGPTMAEIPERPGDPHAATPIEGGPTGARPADPDPSCPLVSRRTFIAGLGATALVAAYGGYRIGLWRRSPLVAGSSSAATTQPAGAPLASASRPDGARTLVVVEMGGGNDGLSMVVPHADPRYHDLRPATAIDDPLDLDGEIGLHPALAGLADRYRAGQVAIVEGVGYPDPDLSHFVSMATWWTASPGGLAETGWLGRYLDGVAGFDDPLAGVVVGPGPSRAMQGDASYVVTIQDDGGVIPPLPPWIDDRDELVGAWAGFAPADLGMAPGDGDDPVSVLRRDGLLVTVRTAIDATVRADATLRDALGVNDRTPTDGRGRRRRRGLQTQLDLAARLVLSDHPPRIIYVHGFGDFDTHQGQVGRHGALMEELDAALTAFWDTVEAGGAGGNVLMLTTSEFGRRPRDNGSGTDHGTAAPHLVIGPSVVGGRHGAPPSLTKLDRSGNLVHEVDLRSVYATVLDRWFGADADDLLGGTHERLSFLPMT